MSTEVAVAGVRQHFAGYRLAESLSTASGVRRYQGIGERLGNVVIIELVDSPQRDSADAMTELLALQRLRHPHLPHILAVDQWDGRPGYVLPPLDGETLAKRLQSHPRWSIEETCRLGAEIASALSAIHGVGLAHRRVQPENIFLEASGGVKLLRGCTAPRTGEISLLSDDLGEPGYLAPEQASCESFGSAADLFGLGAVMYRLLTGRAPFVGATREAAYRSVIVDPLTSAKQLNPLIPESLDFLLSRLLAKLPSRRPESAVEVEIKLREYVSAGMSWVPSTPQSTPPAVSPVVHASPQIAESAPVTVRHVDVIVSPEQTPPKRSRSWGPDILAAVLLLTAGYGLYQWWSYSRAQEPPPSPGPENRRLDTR